MLRATILGDSLYFCDDAIETLQPFGQVLDHHIVTRKTGIEAEAVTAGREGLVGVGNACILQRRPVLDAVRRLDGRVVVCPTEIGGRCLSFHLKLVAVECHKLVARIVAQKVLTRTCMGVAAVHRHDGIEEDLEGWQLGSRKVRGDGACQMSACREAHYANQVRLYS